MLLLGFRKRREGFSVQSRSLLSLFFAAREKSGKEVLIHTHHTHTERERERERKMNENTTGGFYYNDDDLEKEEEEENETTTQNRSGMDGRLDNATGRTTMMMGGGGGEDEKALPLPAGAAATTTTTTTKAASSLVLPNDHVRQFVSFLHKRIGESSSSSSSMQYGGRSKTSQHEIGNLYEKSFPAISERYFKHANWPKKELVVEFLEKEREEEGGKERTATTGPTAADDEIFLALYEELYFRHVYSRTSSPSIEERVESWKAYCRLFDCVLNEGEREGVGGVGGLVLPNVWLWDMVDEFIYQFQSFCQFRGKLQAKSEKEIERLKELKDEDDVWQKEKVEAYLEALQNKRKEKAEREQEEATLKEEEESDEKKVRRSNVLDTLGYFAIVGLARVQCLSGDYELSLKTFDALPDLQGGRSLHARIPGCHVSVNYHVGFAYFMLNRYKDAAKFFNRGISHVERLQMNLRRRENGGGGGKSTGSHSPGGRIELLRKKSEQMLSLLAIGIPMSCGSGSTSSGGVMRSLDDHTRSVLREKYGDKMAKMNNGETDAFADLFAFACPKFIATNEIIKSTGSGEYAADPSLSYNQEAYKKQLAVFVEEVQQRAPLPKLKSYLRLYTTISVQKLAHLMEVTEDELKKNLEVMREKSSNVVEYRREYCKSLLDGVEVSKLNASSAGGGGGGGTGATSHWNNFDAFDFALEEDGKTIKVFDHYTQNQQHEKHTSSTSPAAAPTKDAEIFSRHIHRLSKLMEELK